MENWFSELEKYLNKSIKIGDTVSGRVIEISNEYAFIDIGLKKEALLPVSEIKKKDGSYLLKEGDEIQAVVVDRIQRENIWILSFKKFLENKLWEELKKAYKNKSPIEVKILSLIKGGCRVEFKDLLQGFMPFSHSFFKNKLSNLEDLVGKIIKVKILEIKDKNFIVSRKEVLKEEYEIKRKKLMEKIKENKILEGKVIKKVDGGFLIDIEGIFKAYLPYKELSWQRLENPSKFLKINQKVRFKVLYADLTKEKIKVSIKALLPDPWEDVAKKYQEGQVVKGKIIKVLNFGAFLELESGIEGLIPKSEITWNRKIKIEDVIKEGDVISAVILKIQPEKRKLILSLRKILPNPWEEIASSYKVGDIVEGKVEKILPTGLIVEITPEITGFIPLKELISETKKIHSKDISKLGEFKVGDKIKGKIILLDPENQRLHLSYLKYKEELEKQEIAKYKLEGKGSPLITLGEILSQKLKLS